MIKTVCIVFSVLLLGVLTVPAFAQSSSDHVVINEVDLNPPGDDSKNISEWVEIYNPTNSKIDISGWKVASTTVLKKTLTLSSGTVIEPGQFLKYSYQSIWFTDSNDSIELRDENGMIIDKTPLLSDMKNDFYSWQRIYDGYDTDSSSDWKFAPSNAGSTNGVQTSVPEQETVSITLNTDQPNYIFGQTAIISGSVSEQVVITKPYFQPAKIVLKITGPNYYKILDLYPDLNLNYKITINLQKVLGVNEGTYDLSVSYDNATSNTSFTVGDKIIVPDKTVIGENLSISTDNTQYIPGQTITISATANKIIPLEGLKFKVIDPSGNIISTGNLFPTNGKFSTTMYLTTVNPNYGTYEIVATYSNESTTTSFELVKDIVEDKLISLWTDKEVYGLGDTVNVSGRLNGYWISSLDFAVVHQKNTALSSGAQSGGTGFKISDVVRLDGSSKFNYSFKIPNDNSRLGDYRITVSENIGTVSKSFRVVENPDTYVPSTEPLTITTNKSVYDFSVDNKLEINGHIANPVQRTSYEISTVKIIISTEDGKPLEIIGLPKGAKIHANGGVVAGYEFTAIPDASGSFSVNADLSRNLFSEGKYVVEAQYEDLSTTSSFDVVDLLELGNVTINAKLNKSVYGLGDIVNLTGTLGAQSAATQGLKITLYKPTGDTDRSGAIIDSGFFSWQWQTPTQEKTVVVDRDRSTTPTNYGVYRIHLATESQSTDLFFKISPNPETDTLDIPPVSVSTSKSLYKSGEKLLVQGTVIKRSQGDEGLVVPERVTIKVTDGKFPYKQIYESQVYPNQGGGFQSTFELPHTVFATGEYKVKAVYQSKTVESVFSVVNDFTFGIDDDISLLVSTDNTQYYPGDVVQLTGKPNKLIYLEKFDISVIKKSENQITCGSFYCGTHMGDITTIRPSSSGSFSYQYKIPDKISSIGKYEITVDADFDTKSVTFDVVEKPLVVKQPSTIIEKENRISDSQISITAQQKISNDTKISPRVIRGSLLTSAEDQSNVNLRLTSESGVCVIGPEPECLVTDSTRKPGQIYEIVTVDNQNLKIRYSGPDARLEKFDIIPESSDEFLPDTTWNVDIIKDDQPSRFYYKVSYKTIE